MAIQHEANQPSNEGAAPASGEANVPAALAEQASEVTLHSAIYTTGTDALPKGDQIASLESLEQAESGTFELDKMLQTSFLH